MQMMIERRGDFTGRVPLHLPIELEFSGMDEPFEADGVDISVGGFAVKTASLPTVGTHLTCRLAADPFGAAIHADGEVVWTRCEGPRRGEFGVRFRDISTEQRALIGEMVAELEAYGAPVPADNVDIAEAGSIEPAVLTLDASQAEIEGCLAERSEAGARFEQTLSLLQVGQGLWLEDGEGTQRHAHITAVSLRVEGTMPLLAVQVAFDEGGGRTTVVSLAGATVEAARDTVPDLEAPEMRFERAEDDDSVHTRPTLSGVELERYHDLFDDHMADTVAAIERERRTPMQVELPLEDPAVEPPRQARSIAEAIEAVVAESDDANEDYELSTRMADKRDDVSICFDLSEDEGEEADDVATHREASMRRGLADFRAALDASPLFQQGGPTLRMVAYTSRAVEGLRQLRQRWVDVEFGKLLQRSGAAAGQLRAVLARPKRRTAGKTRRDGTIQRLGRRLPLLAMAMLAMTGVGLLAYALTPESDPLLVEASQKSLASPEITSIALAPAPAAPSAIPAVVAAQPSEATSQPAAVPVPNEVPANSPYAVDVNEDTTRQVAAVASNDVGPHFGATRVPHARRFTLHMTADIKELRGLPDRGGFSVVILGALSLDRAGPIAAAHEGVQRSMILNKGDRSELTIRFAEGKNPSYRVTAHGSELYIDLAR